MEQALRGKTDLDFLKRVFGKLTANFGWWVNRKDRFGRSLFEGGFLGLDNIGVFDRSAPLPTGGYLEQADGTAWVALFCQNMIEIAFELAAHDPTYEELATNYVMEFLLIARAMNGIGPDGMWDEEDGFYYDVLRLPDGNAHPAQGSLDGGPVAALRRDSRREVAARARAGSDGDSCTIACGACRSCATSIHATGPGHFGVAERGIIGSGQRRPAAPHPDPHARRERVPQPLRDSRVCRAITPSIPMSFSVGGQEYRVAYLPAESDTGMFGGNSNWRGPIWMPVNALIIRALLHYFAYYGDNFKIECPTGSGNLMNLFEVADEIADRLTRIFLCAMVDGGRSSAAAKNSSAIPTGGTICCSTSTSTATMVPASEPVTRPAGPEWSPL